MLKRISYCEENSAYGMTSATQCPSVDRNTASHFAILLQACDYYVYSDTEFRKYVEKKHVPVLYPSNSQKSFLKRDDFWFWHMH